MLEECWKNATQNPVNGEGKARPLQPSLRQAGMGVHFQGTPPPPAKLASFPCSWPCLFLAGELASWPR